jgi:iron complex outermembrane receptor protein
VGFAHAARVLLTGGLGGLSLAAPVAAAPAGIQQVDIRQSSLGAALIELGRESGTEILFDSALVRDLPATPLRGRLSTASALSALLADSGLTSRQTAQRVFVIARAPAAGPPGDGAVAELLVRGRHTQNADIRRAENDVQGYRIATQRSLQLAHRENLDEYMRSREPTDAHSRAQAQDRVLRPGSTHSEIDLLGLGSRRTLVLVDGRRMPRTPLSEDDFEQADLGGVPLGAVERVETLTGAAGGIYGPGAVGGVVNVILRRDYRGADLNVVGGLSSRGDAAHWRFEGRGGWTSPDGATQVMVFGAYSASRPLLAGQRDFFLRARRRLLANDPAAYLATEPTSKAVSVFSAGGPLALDRELGGTGLNATYTYLPLNVTGTAAERAAALVANAGRFVLDPPSDRSGTRGYLTSTPKTSAVLLNLRQRLSDQVEVYVDGLYARNHGEGSRTTEAFVFSSAANAPNNPFDQPVDFRFPTPGFTSRALDQNDVVRASAGIIAELPFGWRASADISGGGARAKTRVDSFGPAFFPFASAVASGQPGVNGSPPLFPLGDWNTFVAAMLRYGESDRLSIRLENQFADASLRLSGPGPRLPGGDLTMTVAAEHRTEHVPRSAIVFETTGHVGTSPTPSRQETVSSAYMELRAPLAPADAPLFLLRGAEMQVAVRHDLTALRLPQQTAILQGPEDQLTTVRRRATVFTVGGKVSPVRQLLLRASLASGQMNPTIDDLRSLTLQVTSDVLQLEDSSRGGRHLGTEAPYTLLSGGSLDTQAIRGKTLSFGVVVNPTADALPRVSIDYSRIETAREVVAFPLAAAALLVNQANYPDRVLRGPLTEDDRRLGFTAGPVVLLDTRALNSGQTVAEAIDGRLDWYVRQGGDAEVHLYARALWQLDFKRRGAQNQPWTHYVGRADGPLRWRGNAGLEWNRGPLTVEMNVQHLSGYGVLPGQPTAGSEQIVRYQGSTRIPAQTYVDAAVNWRFAGRPFNGLVRSFELRSGVQNLFDHGPPILADPLGLLPYAPYSDPRRRRFEIGLFAQF